jgi:hypothetical protein
VDQLLSYLGVLLNHKPSFAGCLGKPKSRKAERYHMEAGMLGTAGCPRFDNFFDLHE